MLLIPSVATSAAPGTGKERQVVKERLEAPSNPDVPARLRYGILMVPGSERVTSKNGKTVFERVDGVPERDQYSISPAGVLAFHRKNRGDALLASYTYRPRRVAVLPIQMDAGPKELKQRTRRDTCELFQAFGYEVVPESRVENLVQQRRLYASSTLDAATLTDLGKELGADDVVVVQTVEWTQAAGKSLASMVISRNPFGGPSKNVKVVLHSRLFDASDGRLVWESHQTSNRRGSTLFGVSDDLKRLAVNKAIIDLFASYFEP
jgi:hypothetical protein